MFDWRNFFGLSRPAYEQQMKWEVHLEGKTSLEKIVEASQANLKDPEYLAKKLAEYKPGSIPEEKVLKKLREDQIEYMSIPFQFRIPTKAFRIKE